MKTVLRLGLVGLIILATVSAALLVVTDPRVLGSGSRSRRRPGKAATIAPSPTASKCEAPAEPVPLYSEGFMDDSGFGMATVFMPTDYDRSSLEAHRKALSERSARGIASFQEQLARIPRGLAPQADAERAKLEMLIGSLQLHDGRFEEASRWIEQSMRDGTGLLQDVQTNLLAMLGVASLRRGEVDNCVACVGPSSCIFPLALEAKHQFPSGSRAALRHFLDYLERRPEDLGVRWLLNVAAMTLGEYPASVPEKYRITLDRFRSTAEAPRFVNVSAALGLGVRGPNMAGGSAFDDFNGDGRPDLFFSSCDWDTGASLFLQRDDGEFEEQDQAKAGLRGQDMSLNLQHADYDNDGDLDVLILRGGWETKARVSLLRNRGNGTFEDVTQHAGMDEPIAAHSAAWGDYDNDGRIDVYVSGEKRPDTHDAQNDGRLYHNNGDGTFTNVAENAGVLNERWAKGACWGDYDDDGRIDLYVSNMWGANRLYHNEGDGTFKDVAETLGVAEPFRSFSCWFWDYDNDGKLDLFVCGYYAWLRDVIADALGEPGNGERPRLYHNLGGRFEDVTAKVGLDRVMLPMGSNFSDIDNDGYLDMYLGTGQPAYMNLMPNLMFKNLAGRRFADVTDATGTGHLQKGHGVSFADTDGDGDLDLFVEMGGVTPGDRSHNVLFRNEGSSQSRHWLSIKLVGRQTNRGAVGARVQAELVASDGSKRSLHRMVSAGGSFGGNSLVVHLGLDREAEVEALTVSWPVSRTRQVFRHVPADQTIEITEGNDTYRKLERQKLP
jgi:hypothetical protein